MSEFKLRFPGIYDEIEAPLYERFGKECDAINNRGPIDVQALINGTLPKDTPGVGPVIEASEEMVMYNNRKWMPEIKLYNDEAYAKAAGYETIPAMLTYAAYDDCFMTPVPHESRDIMLVAGLNHSVTAIKPIYIGDTLYMIIDKRIWKDITPPEGSIYRTIAMTFDGSIYNQKGELVSSVTFRVRENLKTFAEGKKPEKFAPWEGPAWSSREDHCYTDADWEKIKEIWSKEYNRGSEVLYWEDVNIGDEPAWTLDGPVDDTLEPIPSWGQGLGGSRTLKSEITDPEIFKTMKRNPVDGIYRLEKRSMSYPKIPDIEITDKMGNPHNPAEHTGWAENDDPMCQPPERAMLINYFGRDCAIRHFINWCGDKGWLKNISWGIMPNACMKNYGYNLPPQEDAVDFLSMLPDVNGKCAHHAMERDVLIVKSRVFDKHIVDGEHLVELGWWIEVLTGEIVEEGRATITLPSKG